MANLRRHWTFVSLLLAGACGLTGCESGGHFNVLGYSTQPPFDPGIRSVYVPIPENVSFRKDIEFDLHRQVVNELNLRSGAPRVTSERARADTELLLKVVNTRKTTLILNQAGEARDAELALYIEVVWRDLRPGHIGDILSNPQRYDTELKPLPGEVMPMPPNAIPLVVTPMAMFIPELGGSFATAERQAVSKAAVQIVNMMEIRR